MKKDKSLIIWITILLAVVLSVTVFYIKSLPERTDGTIVSNTINEYVNREEYSFLFSLLVVNDDERYKNSADVFKTTIEEKEIITIGRDNTVAYFYDNNIYSEFDLSYNAEKLIDAYKRFTDKIIEIFANNKVQLQYDTRVEGYDNTMYSMYVKDTELFNIFEDLTDTDFTEEISEWLITAQIVDGELISFNIYESSQNNDTNVFTVDMTALDYKYEIPENILIEIAQQ